jgi:hypothetical protein
LKIYMFLHINQMNNRRLILRKERKLIPYIVDRSIGA